MAEWQLMYGSIRGLFDKTFTGVVYRLGVAIISTLKTIATLVKINYSCKSFIKLTPEYCRILTKNQLSIDCRHL